MGEAGVGGHRYPFVMETGVVKLPKSSVPSSSRPSLFLSIINRPLPGPTQPLASWKPLPE